MSSVTSHFSRLKPTLPQRNPDASKTTGSTGLSLESDSQSSSTEDACIPQSYSNHSNLFSITVVKDVLYSPWAGILFLTGTETTTPFPVVAPLAPITNESQPTDEKKSNTKSLLRCVSASQFERSKLPLALKLNNSENRFKPTPEILVSSIDGAGEDEPINFRRSKRSLSHSSSSVEPTEEGVDCNNLQRASSETSLGNQANVKSSNSSELNAYNIGANVLSNVKQSMGILLTSPTSGKGNPLALFARGVQNIGASFDSRKKSLDSNVNFQNPNTIRVDKKENELENICQTKIIRL